MKEDITINDSIRIDKREGLYKNILAREPVVNLMN